MTSQKQHLKLTEPPRHLGRLGGFWPPFLSDRLSRRDEVALLSREWGITGQTEPERFMRALDRIVESAKTHGVALAMHRYTGAGSTNINEAIRRGFHLSTLDSDVCHLMNGATDRPKQILGWKH